MELTARGSRLETDKWSSKEPMLRRGVSAVLGLQALGAHSLPGHVNPHNWLSFLRGETITPLR